jgi:8-hydroxy-5-deazaflavin:NADPH oxidoreductase
MQTKQTIAIIGATGNMGSALARSLAKGNYRLLLKSNKQDELKKLVKEIKETTPSAEVEGMACTKEASWEADIIIPAVPYGAQGEVAERIKEVANQKIVVSIANPLNETYTGLTTNGDTSAAEELQKLLPHSKVIKAFNTTFAANFSTPLINGQRADAFIAGNNEEALQTVSELVSTAGFNPIISGNLSHSRSLESMQMHLIQLSIKYNYNWLAGWKVLHN